MKPTLTILVTGASRGIGKAIATELSGPGTLLILMSTRAEDLQETAELCRARGADALCFGIDLTDTSTLDARLCEAIAQSGPVDILVNNAGIWEEKPFEQANIDSWDRAIDVNLKAPMRICKVALETMPDGGAFIFIGSSASKRAYAGGTGYCAGKFGSLDSPAPFLKMCASAASKSAPSCPAWSTPTCMLATPPF